VVTLLEKTQVRIAIGVAAFVWFLIALLTGESLQAVALRTVSLAGTAVTIVFLLYDRFMWKWKLVRRFTKKPDVSGTWRGKLVSDYVREDGTNVPPIRVVIRFKQTNSQIVVTMFTNESQSISEQAQLIKGEDDRWRFSWVYRNTPRQRVQERSGSHRGSCDLHLSGRHGEVLSGQYFTERKTTGEIQLTEWNKHYFNDLKSAFSDKDFKKNTPFSYK
jgi:hypothetical protein